LQNAAYNGPIFISIGDSMKLSKFLELNPSIPSQQIFVDNYEFSTYRNVGFGTMKDMDNSKLKNIKLLPPKLGGFSGWWKYLSNVASISPIEPGNVGIPEGVLRLGGTFVVNNDELVYLWKDVVPGDTPDLEEVMKLIET
jgi:AhpC/TSA antioxidant enzyme